METVIETSPGRARPGDGRAVPRWAVRTAHVLALIALPSGLWRVGIVLGFRLGIENAGAGADTLMPGRQSLAILGLSVLSEALALLSLGLVRPWGEVVPRWMPLVGGRRLPPSLVTATAITGAVALTAVWTFATVNFFRLTVAGAAGQGFVFANGWWETLLVACYVPLLFWGPLLVVLAVAYHRRRRG